MQLPAFTDLGKMRHGAEAIDVASYQVTAQPVVGTHGFLQIDGAELRQTSGPGQRLGGNVNRELALRGVQCGHGHAGAIERDAVAHAHVLEVACWASKGEALAVDGRTAQGVHGYDAPHAGDDSSKHGCIFAGNGPKNCRDLLRGPICAGRTRPCWWT